jgi:chromosome segregation ATPase
MQGKPLSFLVLYPALAPVLLTESTWYFLAEERDQYNAEITEMQGRLEAQKVQLDAKMADLEQKMVSAKTAFNDYKNQHKKLEREEARLQQLLQEPIP